MKSTGEIKEAMHPEAHHEEETNKKKVSYLGVLIQIAILDIGVFFRLRDYGSRHGKPSSSDDFGLCLQLVS